MLKITKKTDNSALTLELEGRLDTVTAPQLEAEIRESINGVTELTLDLEKLDYVSSAGLRVFLSAQKIMNVNGSMKVIRVKQGIMDVFDLTGFTDILTIE